MKLSIQEVINQRLKLDTNVRILNNEFEIQLPTVDKLKSRATVEKYRSWPIVKQNRFIITVGGVMNFDKTKVFLGV